jgi:hypothetical protein
MSEKQDNQSPVVGRVPPRGDDVVKPPNAASGDAAYNTPRPPDVGRLPSAGATVGRVPTHGVPDPNQPPPRRLRRLHRVWPDRDGNISYLLTMCVDGRTRVLDNQDTFQRLVAFLLDSPQRYHWFGRRFVVMPDHIHLIARMGHDAVRLGQWIKALKAVVGGLKPREDRPVGARGLQDLAAVGRVPPHGATLDQLPSTAADVGPVPPPGASTPDHQFTRIPRSWHWQTGFHDHKFRTPESEARKWEYVCLNPVRYHLVTRPEEWPYGGEIFCDDAAGPRVVPGTPPLLETGILIEKDATPRQGRSEPPRAGTRPTT